MSIRSEPAHLPVVRAAVEEMCLMLGFDSKSAGAVVLSVDEALTNIIKHAYGDDSDKTIGIELAPVGGDKPDALKISLTDSGKRADPAKIKSRDLDDVRPGGLGVHIMTECMDTVEFSPRAEGGTLLTMVKSIPPPAEREGQD